MNKFAIMTGGSIFSYGGWYVGSLFGEFGMPLLFSTIFGFIGIVLTWKLIQKLS